MRAPRHPDGNFHKEPPKGAHTPPLSATDVAKVRDYENYAETKTFRLEKAIGKKKKKPLRFGGAPR